MTSHTKPGIVDEQSAERSSFVFAVGIMLGGAFAWLFTPRTALIGGAVYLLLVFALMVRRAWRTARERDRDELAAIRERISRAPTTQSPERGRWHH